MRRLLIAVLGCALGTTSLAAETRSLMLDASVGAKSGAGRVAMSVWYPVFDHKGHVRLGIGLRASAYGGDAAEYVNRDTAMGRLVPQLLIDPSVYALNAAVSGEVDIVRWLGVGANLDVLGLAAGPTRTEGPLEAKVEAGSYFLYGRSDRGALNSEFFALFGVTPRVTIRAGVSHYVTNYTVTDRAAAGTPDSRYQRFETVPFVAVRVRL